MNRNSILLFVSLFILTCSCQYNKLLTGDDQTHTRIIFDYIYHPINITLYKDPEFKNVNYVMKYECRSYSLRPDQFDCTSNTTLDESKKIWGSDIKSCISRYDDSKKSYYERCDFQSVDMYWSLFRPYKVQFLNQPPTRGGQVNITGYFMRAGFMDINNIYFKWFDPISSYNVDVYVPGNYSDPNYDPNNLTIEIPDGFGTRKLCFDKYKEYCVSLSYQAPSINTAKYNHSSQQITITGNNFYNVTKFKYYEIAYFQLDGNNVSTSDLISFDFEKIVLKYSSNQSQSLNFTVYIDGQSASVAINIEPVPTSSTSNVTKYNDGIVDIIGTHLSSPVYNSNITVKIDNNINCDVIYNSNTHIQCKLSKDTSNTQTHTLNVCINSICNSNTILFEYGKPNITEYSQSSTVFTLSGQCHGSYNDNSTKLLLKYNSGKNISTISPLSIKSDETSSSFDIPFFCGNATAQLIVNGIPSNSLTISANPYLEVIQSPSTDSNDTLNVLLSYYDCKYYENINFNPIIQSSQSQGNRINNTYYSFKVNQGTGYKSDIIKFADKNIQFEYSYAKPTVSNHLMSSMDSKSVITINGNNFGTNSSLCNITYNGLQQICQVINHHQITFNLTNIEISANIIITIDGIQSDNYTIALVTCSLVNNQQIKYPTSYGCLKIYPSVQYICKGLQSFVDISNTKLINVTFNGKEIKELEVIGDEISIPIPEYSQSAILNLFLNNILSTSLEIRREVGVINETNIKYDHKSRFFHVNTKGMNFIEPYKIQLPTLLNSSISSDNCSLLLHGSNENQNCSVDIINCQISINNINQTLLDQYSNNPNSIPIHLILNNTTIKSNVTTFEQIQNNSDDGKNKSKVLAAAIVPCVAAFIAAGIFGAYKYHQHKINKGKNKTIDDEKK